MKELNCTQLVLVSGGLSNNQIGWGTIGLYGGAIVGGIALGGTGAIIGGVAGGVAGVIYGSRGTGSKQTNQ